MSPAEPFPLFFPPEARRPFDSEDVLRRIARAANLGRASRVLDLACGPGQPALLLAREFGCQLVAADSDDKALQQLADRAKVLQVSDRIALRKVDFRQLAFGDGEFDAIFLQGRILLRLTDAAQLLRRFLAPRGRLAVTYPVKVGRYPGRGSLELWEKRVGEPVFWPRDGLQVLEKAGYEPEGVETLSDAELSEYYRALETQLLGLPKEQESAARDEIELFRSQSGKASVTYGLFWGRRKEAGEKPPAARDRG